jgi:hypothetical protein
VRDALVRLIWRQLMLHIHSSLFILVFLTASVSAAVFQYSVPVVAYQFGSGVEPMVGTAEPVARTIRVIR